MEWSDEQVDVVVAGANMALLRHHSERVIAEACVASTRHVSCRTLVYYCIRNGGGTRRPGQRGPSRVA